ncbi:hypothetical protein FRC10_006573 [Ceratobasidium sp. 414]|nr:hypothetical protein FRC10_006573 [Ceratobasidium sp. 414]
MDVDAPGVRWQGINLPALIAREDGSDFAPAGSEPIDNASDMDLDEDINNLFAAPPEVPPGPGVQRNPPVNIEGWTSDEEPNRADFALPDHDIDDAFAGYADRDPEFVEWDRPVGLDPDIEPDMDDPELWAFLQQYLGDLALNRDLTDKDRKTLRFLASRLRTHFSRAAYDDLRLHACEELGLPSDFIAWRRLKILAGLESCVYDCCINSCTSTPAHSATILDTMPPGSPAVFSVTLLSSPS